MALVGARVTVTDTATVIEDAGSDDLVVGKSIAVTNRGTNPIDLGGVGVVFGDGYELRADETISIDMTPDEALYGISAAAGSVVIHVLRQGVV